MLADQSLLYKIGITLISGIGDKTAKKLIAYCGGAEAIFKEKKSALLKVPGVGKHLAGSVSNQSVLQRAEQEIAFMEKNDISPLFYLDKQYPERLKHCEDGPVMLYKRGNMDLNPKRVVSIVGTRRASEYGKKMSEEIVEELGALGVAVISGLAYGIDITAHKASIKNNVPTVGVFAHGLDRIYPNQHKRVAEDMLANGAWVTEFMSDTNPDRENFPKRNRIVAGMSDATIVIESGAKGGSLITAYLANSYNRDVFAIPGRVGDEQSQGTHKLIKHHQAALVESASDICYMMNWMEEKQTANKQTVLFTDLNSDEEQLVNLLKKDAYGIDKLSLESNFTVSQTATLLLNLEFKGIVKSLPGKRYSLN